MSTELDLEVKELSVKQEMILKKLEGLEGKVSELHEDITRKNAVIHFMKYVVAVTGVSFITSHWFKW